MRPLRRPGLGCIVSLSVLVAALANVSGTSGSGWETDEISTVTRIVDGDTFDATPVGRIRLADVDTPEVGRPGAQEAADYLSSLIWNRVVYLDADDLYVNDVYGRMVAVVYVRHNATHLLNVNEAMLEAGLASVADFLNEFDPTAWSSYVRYPVEATPSVYTLVDLPIAFGPVIASLITAVLVLIVLRMRWLRS